MRTFSISIRDGCIAFMSLISLIQMSMILIIFLFLQPIIGFTHHEDLNFAKHITLRVFALLIFLYTLFHNSYESHQLKLPRIGIENELLLYFAGIVIPTCIAIAGEVALAGRSVTSMVTVPLMISLAYVISYWIQDSATMIKAVRYFIWSVLIVCIIGYLEFGMNLFLEFNMSGRIRSVFVDPNIFGRYLLLGIFILLPLMIWKDYTIFSKKFLYLLLFIFSTNLLLSLSRSSYLTLVAGLIFLVFYVEKKKTRILFVTGTLIAAISIFTFLLMQRSFTGSALVDPSNINRIHLIQGGIEMIESNWLTGVGYTNFAHYFEQNYLENALSVSTEAYKYAGFATEIHNWVIEIVAEQGIIGLLIFLLLFKKIFYRLHIAWKYEVDTAQRCLLLSGSLIIFTFLFHGFFYHTFISQFFFWTVGGFILAHSKISLKASGRFNE